MVSIRVLTLASLYQLGAAVSLWAVTLLLWPTVSLATLAGGLLMAANFGAIRFVATRAFAGERPKLGLLLLLAVKLAVTLGVMGLLLLVFRLDPLGLALGLSTFFAGVGLATVHNALSPCAAGVTPSPT